jgi:hypothetical protein
MAHFSRSGWDKHYTPKSPMEGRREREKPGGLDQINVTLRWPHAGTGLIASLRVPFEEGRTVGGWRWYTRVRVNFHGCRAFLPGNGGTRN